MKKQRLKKWLLIIAALCLVCVVGRVAWGYGFISRLYENARELVLDHPDSPGVERSALRLDEWRPAIKQSKSVPACIVAVDDRYLLCFHGNGEETAYCDVRLKGSYRYLQAYTLPAGVLEELTASK